VCIKEKLILGQSIVRTALTVVGEAKDDLSLSAWRFMIGHPNCPRIRVAHSSRQHQQQVE